MRRMTEPLRSAARRIVLLPVEDRRDEQLRRYRIARVRLAGADPALAHERFAHLKRTYD